MGGVPRDMEEAVDRHAGRGESGVSRPAVNRTPTRRPRTFTRRGIVSGALGAAGAASLSSGLSRLDGLGVEAQGDAAGPIDLIEPPVCRSVDGVLETILVAQAGSSNVAESTMNFNGIVPGPTLRLAQGERLRIKLVNRLPLLPDEMDVSNNTNLHVHGLHVSPLGHGDDVLRIDLKPGEKWVYEYDIRPDHQAGTFWYHPHRHHNVLAQVRAGMAGAIIIEGDLDELPQTKGVPERLLVLQGDFVPDRNSVFLVNGQLQPTIRMNMGERQRWRFLNASYENFYNLHLEGHTFDRISVDGNYLRDIAPAETILLGPAERADVLIEPTAPGTFPLFSRAWEGSPNEFQLATLVVAAAPPGAAAAPPAPLDAALVDEQRLPDLRTAADKVQRTLTFVSVNRMRHSADGEPKFFDPERVDQWVKLGATERWIIQNPTESHWHPFHLHVNDLQVVSSNGEEQLQPFVFYKDTVPVPARKDGVDGKVELLIPFLDFPGRFVYHCHILDHEDRGMMGVVEVMQPIDIIDSAFSETAIDVPLHTTVQWTNLDSYPHTVTADDRAFLSGPLQPGDEFRYAFDTPGIYEYHCEYHPKMQGTIVVAPEIEPTEPLEVPIDIMGAVFAPDSIAISACQTVQWTNRDAVPHVLLAEDGPATSTILNPGDTYLRTFYVPGSYRYRLADVPESEGVVDVT